MTRYNLYIHNWELNAYGAPPADASLGPADLPEKPAVAKHTAKETPKENKQGTATQPTINNHRGHNAWELPTRLTHALPVAKSSSSAQLVSFSSLRGGSYPLVLMETEISQRGHGSQLKPRYEEQSYNSYRIIHVTYHVMQCMRCTRIIGNQGTVTQLAINISVNHWNPNHSDSTGNHESVKAFIPRHGDSADNQQSSWTQRMGATHSAHTRITSS
ncbi:sodium/hydrogen exchanger 8 [Dorcoceras hygrometricum]|uniref:Sodium/hydrogen exchanger 8 n=1 Tax=Dorcoceras hygrometricum TaxID=472368 RepID=A0A2Z7BA39_9LAMI|nr:sodium/hydrogen exchanger 8 [Dorcoceras hygrometricum]